MSSSTAWTAGDRHVGSRGIRERPQPRKVAIELLGLLLLSLAFLAIACGDGDDVDGGGGGSPTADGALEGGGGPAETRVEVVAENLEFNEERLIVAANSRVTVVLDNQDEGVLHNFSVYRTEQASGPIHVGQLVIGVTEQEETFQSPAAGSYFFRCDSHPDTMRGSFVTR